MLSTKLFWTSSVLASSAVLAFPTSPATRTPRSTSILKVAVDPTTVTKKEYEDICGVSFDADTLEDRLKATNYLYPKHVEVIDDIAPIAGAMVDEIVSVRYCCLPYSPVLLLETKGPLRAAAEPHVAG
jgi:hypothetical protein